MKLYPELKEYQKKLVNKNLDLIKAVLIDDQKILGRQVSIAPTGSGKTFMMGAIIESALKIYENISFIWLTHNKQILYQTENEIMDALGHYVTKVYSIEKGIKNFGGRVLLFNVQKGVSPKAKIWLKNWYEVNKNRGQKIIFIVDEADEGMSGRNMNSLKKILHPILDLGFTASFKKKDEEYEFYRVFYKDVIEAGMLVKTIEYQASDEVTRNEMMIRAIEHRNELGVRANRLKLIDRYFVPKLLVQTKASEAENIAREIKKYLELNQDEFEKIAVIHIQNSRGLEQIESLEHIQYIIGDLMLERGWNCPEAYVLLSTKDTINEAKGIQLLGRVIRLPHAEPFDELYDEFNRGYVYISGKHSIEKSCQKFANQDVNPLPPPIEVIQVDKRKDVNLPIMITFMDELDKEFEDRDLILVTESLCEAIEGLRKRSEDIKPSVRRGKLSLENTSLMQDPIEQLEKEWDYEYVKKILVDALSKNCPRGYANLVVTKYQIKIKDKGGLLSVAPFAKDLAANIKNSGTIRKICNKLEYLCKPYVWPAHKLVIAQPAPIACRNSLYPKMHLNQQEMQFVSYLDDICDKYKLNFVRNDRSDIRLFKSHFPDFIIFDHKRYVFVEFKGRHLLNTSETIKKNIVGQQAHDYLMVYQDDNSQYILLGRADEKDERLTDSVFKSLFGKI